MYHCLETLLFKAASKEDFSEVDVVVKAYGYYINDTNLNTQPILGNESDYKKISNFSEVMGYFRRFSAAEKTLLNELVII